MASRSRRRRFAREGRAVLRSARRALAARPRRQGRLGVGAAFVGRAACSSGRPMRPTSCRAATAGYRSALLNTMARGARHLDGHADKAPAGLKRVTAWCGVVAAGLVIQGGVRAARARRGRAGAGARLGAVRRRRADQPVARTSRCCWSTGWACCAPAMLAAKQTMPDAHRDRLGGGARRAPRGDHGRRRTVQLAGLQPRRSGAPERLDRRLRAARPAAAPGARLGLSADVARSARSSSRRRAAAAAEDGRRRLGLDPGVRAVGRRPAAGGQLRRAGHRSRPTLPPDLVQGAAHDRRAFAPSCSTTPIRPASWPTARSAAGSRTSPSSAARTMTRAGSRPAMTAMSAASA